MRPEIEGQEFHTEPMILHKGVQLNIETGVMQMLTYIFSPYVYIKSLKRIQIFMFTYTRKD